MGVENGARKTQHKGAQGTNDDQLHQVIQREAEESINVTAYKPLHDPSPQFLWFVVSMARRPAATGNRLVSDQDHSRLGESMAVVRFCGILVLCLLSWACSTANQEPN